MTELQRKMRQKRIGTKCWRFGMFIGGIRSTIWLYYWRCHCFFPFNLLLKRWKKNKYFLNLKKSNKEKSCVPKILKSDWTITFNPKSIMSELESFYSNLYKENNRLPSFFLDDLKDFQPWLKRLYWSYNSRPHSKCSHYQNGQR